MRGARDAASGAAVREAVLGFRDEGVTRSLRFACEEVVPRLSRTPTGNLQAPRRRPAQVTMLWPERPQERLYWWGWSAHGQCRAKP